MVTKSKFLFVGWVWVSAILVGCSPESRVSSEGLDEVAQQVGDVMASIDETGGPQGTLSQLENSYLKMERRLDPHFEFPGLIPNAFASSCITSSSFSMCSASRSMTRTFNDCTLGLATFAGTVKLTWGGTSGSGCSLGIPSAGGTITRAPDYTVTGLRGATLKVGLDPSAALGQRLTYVGGLGSGAQFNFSSDGIRRVFTLPDGSPLIDFTTRTLDNLVLTGVARSSSRVLNGGTLEVKNNLSDFKCDFTPNQVTWSPTCTCPVSGTWRALCSDGTNSSIELTGCGSAEFTFGLESQTISFDRCVGI